MQEHGRVRTPSATPAAQVPKAPTGAEIEQLADARLELERLLLERSLRRIAALMLDYQSEAKVLFIEVDSFLDYVPTGWSRDEQLSEPGAAESLEDYQETECAAGNERELEDLVANLHDWDFAWKPYTRFQHPDSGRYSLDLAAIRTAHLPPRPRAASWWTVIGDWSSCPDAALAPWTELVRAPDADTAARIAERRRKDAEPQGPRSAAHNAAAVLPRAYSVHPGALPPAAQYT